MFKMLLAFVFVFALFFFGILAFRKLTGKEKWQLTKLLGYSTICAVLTGLALIGMVLIF